MEQDKVRGKKSTELVPFTIDLVRSLNGYDRLEALRMYNEWLKLQRKKDKKEVYAAYSRLETFMKKRLGLCSNGGCTREVATLDGVQYKTCIVCISKWRNKK